MNGTDRRQWAPWTRALAVALIVFAVGAALLMPTGRIYVHPIAAWAALAALALAVIVPLAANRAVRPSRRGWVIAVVGLVATLVLPELPRPWNSRLTTVFLVAGLTWSVLRRRRRSA